MQHNKQEKATRQNKESLKERFNSVFKSPLFEVSFHSQHEKNDYIVDDVTLKGAHDKIIRFIEQEIEIARLEGMIEAEKVGLESLKDKLNKLRSKSK